MPGCNYISLVSLTNYKLFDAGKTIINHPFTNSLRLLPNLSLVIWGRVYDCLNQLLPHYYIFPFTTPAGDDDPTVRPPGRMELPLREIHGCNECRLESRSTQWCCPSMSTNLKELHKVMRIYIYIIKNYKRYKL